eukprot:546074-Alexandrium_andersonii.AAC.1
MSASLVGSEMCIRDRAIATTEGMLRVWRNSVSRAVSSDNRRCSLQSVSYTHLTLPTICSV